MNFVFSLDKIIGYNIGFFYFAIIYLYFTIICVTKVYLIKI